jgi:hypothetical protein
MESADENGERTAEVLDDLAAFLMHHAYSSGMTDADRLQTFAIVQAYQEGDDPATVELIMRDMAFRFRDRSEYRPEWRPRPQPAS